MAWRKLWAYEATNPQRLSVPLLQARMQLTLTLTLTPNPNPNP